MPSATAARASTPTPLAMWHDVAWRRIQVRSDLPARLTGPLVQGEGHAPPPPTRVRDPFAAPSSLVSKGARDVDHAGHAR